MSTVSNRQRANENSPEPKKRRTKEKLPRTPSIEFRLTPEDFDRFDRLCRLDGKTRRNQVRQAVHFYLNARENASERERNAGLAKQIREGFDRLATLYAGTNKEIRALQSLVWQQAPKNTRE